MEASGPATGVAVLTPPPPVRRMPVPTANAGHVAPPRRRPEQAPAPWAPPAPRVASPRVPTPPPAERPGPRHGGRHAGAPVRQPGVDPRPSGRHVRPDVVPEERPRTAAPRTTARPTGTSPGLPVALPADVTPARRASRVTPGVVPAAPRRRGRGVPLGLGAAMAGALMAGTMVTVDTISTGTADPLASADHLLQEIPGGAEPVESVGPATAPEAPRIDLAGAVAAGEEAGGRNGATVGVAAIDLATGELAPGSSGEQTFDTASLAKLFLVVDMLQRQRDGELTLGARDVRLVNAALVSSSDPAMNALWTQYDGPGAITRVSQSLDLEDTSTPEDSSQWGEVQTSARDMVKLLRHVQADLPQQDRDLVLGAMGRAARVAGDGFDQAFGFLDGATPVKQGWMCCLQGRAEVHSAGIVDGRYMVAVLSSAPPGYDQARQNVSAAAGALREHLRPVSSAG
ncbi:serine hydrolase [Actinomycetospora flava]|uniref:Beta-lactamase class A catalytic domain-containing protein n=1 Tax=Actinomycetospora flava TaxID=3129232 RepID=A0ABU8LYW4_9PSEU